jgi:hypothetical protein
MAEFKRTEGVAGSLFGGALASAWLRDAQAWTGLQCELLSGVEALWAECARRQGEAIEASTRTVQGLLDGSNVVEVAQIQRDWLASAARRTADTLGRWAGDSAVSAREDAVSVERKVAANESAAPPPVQREAAE